MTTRAKRNRGAIQQRGLYLIYVFLGKTFKVSGLGFLGDSVARRFGILYVQHELIDDTIHILTSKHGNKPVFKLLFRCAFCWCIVLHKTKGT